MLNTKAPPAFADYAGGDSVHADEAERSLSNATAHRPQDCTGASTKTDASEGNAS